MKKCTLLLLLCTALVAGAQNGTLPDAISQSFAAKFPKAKKVKWTPEDVNEFSAWFENDSVSASALFETDGKWINTLTEVMVTKLPPALLAGVKQKYPKAKIVHAAKMEHYKKGQYYEIDLKIKDKTETYYFKSDGTEML